MFGYSTEMFAIWLTFSYIMFSAVFPTSALSEVELKVKYGKGKGLYYDEFYFMFNNINESEWLLSL